MNIQDMDQSKEIADMRADIEARRAEAEALMIKPVNEIDSPYIRKCLGMNALGDGLLYCSINKGRYLFNKAMDGWMVWAGHHWELDVMDRAKAAVEDVVGLYLQEIKYIQDEIGQAAKDENEDLQKKLRGIKDALEKRGRRLRDTRGRANCLQFSHTNFAPIAIRGDEVDRQPYLFPCKNGVINLKTGELKAGDPDDHLLKASPVEWKGIDEPCPEWEQFLMDIFSKNKKLVDFVQRLFGYSLVGVVKEHIIAVLTGQGRNGKGTIVDILSYILGNLAGPIRSEMLLDQGRQMNSTGPTPDIMSLRGLRMAFASETDENCKISPARVKWLTGADELTGRNPHDKYEITFRPTHTLFLLTNHKPHAPADDFAFWERTIIVPFDLSYVDREPRSEKERRADKDLPEKLKKESSGILAWLVKGCLQWQQMQGLHPPSIVKEATAEYRRDEDLIGDFIDDCCEIDPAEKVPAKDVYEKFEKWWEENISKKVPKQRWFGKIFGKRYERVKLSGYTQYIGVGLKDTGEDIRP